MSHDTPHPPASEYSDRWASKAGDNVDRWGEQPPDVLLLALVEEVAETIDELLKTAEKGTETMVPAEAMARLAAVRDAGFECRAFLEREFEDETGDPLPREEWPTLVWDFDADAVREELDDAAPLVYQLAWALDEWESKRPFATDGGEDLAPRVYDEDGDPLRPRIVGGSCAGEVSGEGHYAYTGVEVEATGANSYPGNVTLYFEPDVATDGGREVPGLEPERDDDEWDPQPATLRDGETREDSHANRNAELVRDGLRELRGLVEDIHICEPCDREFDDLDELADHDCRPEAGVELSARDVVERTGGA